MSGLGSERTIAAISSPPGGGTRGVIRVSGARAAAILRAALEDEPPAPFPETRCLFRAELDDGVGTQPALVLWMPGPRSFTREDVVELHLPGAAPLLACALRRLFDLGAEPAAPGEFTRRAFENGRLDLTRAEGVLELVEASSEAERRSAAALLSGGLARRLAPLREGVDSLRALCEASLDFDAEDTGSVPEAELLELFERTRAGLEEALGWERARAGVRGLPRIVLAGAPNAGKSSLFNVLAEEGAALVTELEGTTRDVLEAPWRVLGAECELADAPGLERAAAGADRRAQELARDRRSAADLVLWVVDASRPDPLAARAELEGLDPGIPRVLVWNQIDRPGTRREPPEGLLGEATRWCATSVPERAGLAALERAAGEVLGLSGAARSASAGEARALSERHRASLERARDEVGRARAGLREGRPLDQVAEILRAATAALDGISGTTTPEDVLDRIFAQFCLGK